MFEWKAYTYIMTNHTHSVLYIWVTSDLHKRLHQHKQKVYDKSFTAKYNCDMLVYYEEWYELWAAIEREKQLKKRSKVKKINLINTQNPEREDLSREIVK